MSIMYVVLLDTYKMEQLDILHHMRSEARVLPVEVLGIIFSSG